MQYHFIIRLSDGWKGLNNYHTKVERVFIDGDRPCSLYIYLGDSDDELLFDGNIIYNWRQKVYRNIENEIEGDESPSIHISLYPLYMQLFERRFFMMAKLFLTQHEKYIAFNEFALKPRYINSLDMD